MKKAGRRALILPALEVPPCKSIRPLATAARSESNKSNFITSPTASATTQLPPLEYTFSFPQCDDLTTAACHDAFSAVPLHISPPKNTRLSFAATRRLCVFSERPSSARDRTNLCRLHPACGASIASSESFHLNRLRATFFCTGLCTRERLDISRPLPLCSSLLSKNTSTAVESHHHDYQRKRRWQYSHISI